MQGVILLTENMGIGALSSFIIIIMIMIMIMMIMIISLIINLL